jgi:hypothetical protein
MEIRGNGRGAVRLGQPLWVIGWGGTGRKIATHLKATFIERFGQVPENVVIVAFDSAEDPVSVREGRRGRVVTLEPKSEFFLLERVPLAGIKRVLDRHPEIAGRLGEDLHRIRRASIHDGTAAERLQGLLALMWNTTLVTQMLNNGVRRLAEREEDIQHELAGGTGINVILVGSTCGGQNSGAMLDCAYLTHEALLALGDLGESSRVMAMVVLPGAFPEVKAPNLLPNTYAFFLDLDRLMREGSFRASYPGHIQVENTEPPFQMVFVLDGVDEHGKVWANVDEVCALAGQALAVLFSTDVGLAEVLAVINRLGVLDGLSTEGFGTYLCTVGQAVIRFPAGQVADRCALRLAWAMAAACLADEPNGQAAFAGLGGTNTLADRLRLNANGAPFEAQIVLPPSAAQAAAEEQPTLARTLVNNTLQRRIYGDAFGQIKATAGRLAEDLAGEMTSGLAAVLAGGRVSPVMGWLRQAQDALQTRYAGLLADAERLAAAAEQTQKTLASASAAMDQAAEGLFIFRKAQVRGAVSRYLDEAGQLVRLRLEQRVVEEAAELVHGVLRQVRGWAQQAGETAARLRQAVECLADQEAELARLAGGRNEINLAEPAVVDQLYNRYAADAVTLAQQVAGQGGSLLAWAQLSVEALAAQLAETAGKVFEPIRELTVESMLTLYGNATAGLAQPWDDRSAAPARSDGSGVQQWIGRLTELAAGAWNLDRALLTSGGADHASFLTIGVPDATESIFANCGHTLVSTHDPERIVALRTVYGASFDTLKPAAAWRRAYEQAHGRTPLHVLGVRNQEAGSRSQESGSRGQGPEIRNQGSGTRNQESGVSLLTPVS